MDLEEELRSSIATNKDLKQERKTLMGIFNCMTEVLDQNNVKIPAPKIVIDLEEDSQNDEVPLVPQMFACHICDYKTGKKEFLTKHISSDHRQQFSCEICSFKSETQELLAKHQRFQHSKNISCEFCGFKTDTAENMRNHKSEFHKVKHYVCEMCDLVLNNEQTLKTHKETHISINCEHCSFKCNSSLKMDDHKKKNHSTSCNLCDFGPDLTDNVQVHKREYHNIKGISCKKCSQVCDSAEALNTHISKVHTISQESPRRRPFCKSGITLSVLKEVTVNTCMKKHHTVPMELNADVEENASFSIRSLLLTSLF